MIKHDINSRRRFHRVFIHIATRSGAEIELSVNSTVKYHKYLKTVKISRNIYSGSSITLSMSPLDKDDHSLREAIVTNTVNPNTATWKSVLRTGTLITVYVNDEYRGAYRVSVRQKITTMSGFMWQITAKGMQNWVQSQSLFFDFGNEFYANKAKAENLQLFKRFYRDGLKDAAQSGKTPQDGIRLTIESFLFDVLSAGDFKFTDGTSIKDKIGYAMASKSYSGKNLTMMQTMGVTQDINIWQQVLKYQSAPFHEIFMTTGGREISLANGEREYLREDKEYLIFRPAPFDDTKLRMAELPPVAKVALTGGEKPPIMLHEVENNIEHEINGDLVNRTDINQSDSHEYSFYSVSLNGLGMDSNMSSLIIPPIVDMESLNAVGKVVLTGNIDSLDMSNIVEGDEEHASLQQLWRDMQLKLYYWFYLGSEFNKGTMNIPFLRGIYEGQHVNFNFEKNPEDSGTYYIEGYDMNISVENLAQSGVTYNLTVARGYNREEPPIIESGKTGGAERDFRRDGGIRVRDEDMASAFSGGDEGAGGDRVRDEDMASALDGGDDGPSVIIKRSSDYNNNILR